MTAFVVLIATPTAVFAQSDDEPKPPAHGQQLSKEERAKFKKLVDWGKVNFAKNNYEKALENFEKAYQIKQSPNLLFNMGLVAEKSGNLARALDYYKTFVVSPNVTLGLRDKAQKRIKVIEPIVEDQQEDEQEARKKAAREKQPDSLAATREDKAAATSKDEGRPRETDVDESADSRSPVGGLLLTGGGVAAIGSGVAFTLLSQQARSTFHTSEGFAARQSAQQSAYMNQWVANGLFLAGVGAATGGVIMLLNRTGGKSSSPRTALRPTLSPDFAGVRFQTAF